MEEADAKSSETETEPPADGPNKRTLLALMRYSAGVGAAKKLLENRRSRVKRQQRVLKRIMALKLDEQEPSISVSDSDSEEGGSAEDDGDASHDERPPMSPLPDDDDSQADGGEAELRRILQRRHRRRQKILGVQEQYTDSTRNAAVMLGEQDIKLSLWYRHRAAAKQAGLPDTGAATDTAATAVALGLIRAGRPAAALGALDHALELEPLSQRLLLARSDCYLLLGQPRMALLDAQEALELLAQPTDAQLRKAQALYALGHFERALVLFHRGLKARPSCPAFRLGIQQAKEAIQNTMAGMKDALRLTELVSLDDSLSEDILPKRAKATEDGQPPENVVPIVTAPEVAGEFYQRLGNVGRYIGDPDSGPSWGSRRHSNPEDGGAPGKVCDSCNTSHSRPPPPPPIAHLAKAAPKEEKSLRDMKASASSPRTQNSNLGRTEAVKARSKDRNIPPALVNDMLFLEHVAELQDGHISALAGDALRFLKSRKLFWQRRGPMESQSKRRRTGGHAKR